MSLLYSNISVFARKNKKIVEKAQFMCYNVVVCKMGFGGK